MTKPPGIILVCIYLKSYITYEFMLLGLIVLPTRAGTSHEKWFELLVRVVEMTFKTI